MGKDYKEMPEIYEKVQNIAIDSVGFAIDISSEVAHSIIYSGAKYATGRSKSETYKSVVFEADSVIGTLTIIPINPASNEQVSYAKALDRGHKLVYFGKPTNRFIQGKHFSEPARRVALDVVKTMFKKTRKI